jgi:hypothetical protein
MRSASRQQTGRLNAQPGPPARAISVGTAPTIAIPVAVFMRTGAVIVGRTHQNRCNDLGHDPPMIAIRGPDDCGSLQIGELRGVFGAAMQALGRKPM